MTAARSRPTLCWTRTAPAIAASILVVLLLPVSGQCSPDALGGNSLQFELVSAATGLISAPSSSLIIGPLSDILEVRPLCITCNLGPVGFGLAAAELYSGWAMDNPWSVQFLLPVHGRVYFLKRRRQDFRWHSTARSFYLELAGSVWTPRAYDYLPRAFGRVTLSYGVEYFARLTVRPQLEYLGFGWSADAGGMVFLSGQRPQPAAYLQIRVRAVTGSIRLGKVRSSTTEL